MSNIGELARWSALSSLCLATPASRGYGRPEPPLTLSQAFRPSSSVLARCGGRTDASQRPSSIRTGRRALTSAVHESLGHIITVELRTGQVYRGKLFDGASAALTADPIRGDTSVISLATPMPRYPVLTDLADARSAEDNLNVSLKDITVTQRDGRVTQLDQVYIRGPMIRLFIVPDMLSNAPMFVPLCPRTRSECPRTTPAVARAR